MLLKGRLHRSRKETSETTRLKPSHSRQAEAGSEIEVLDIEERSLLSFQRPVPRPSDGVKKTSDTRQRPPKGTNRGKPSRAWEAPWSSDRDLAYAAPFRTAEGV